MSGMGEEPISRGEGGEDGTEEEEEDGKTHGEGEERGEDGGHDKEDATFYSAGGQGGRRPGAPPLMRGTPSGSACHARAIGGVRTRLPQFAPLGRC